LQLTIHAANFKQHYVIKMYFTAEIVIIWCSSLSGLAVSDSFVTLILTVYLLAVRSWL